jgi:hypothetical protein
MVLMDLLQGVGMEQTFLHANVDFYNSRESFFDYAQLHRSQR